MSIIICIALHLYSGPVEPGTPVTQLSLECKRVSFEVARPIIAACARQGATKCEVTIDPKDSKKITLENKVSILVD